MPSTRQPPLKEGDKVSIAVRHFGEQYARDRGGSRWASETVRDTGVVVEKNGGKYLIDFNDGENMVWWARSYIRFVERGQAAKRAAPLSSARSSDDDSDGGAPSSDNGGAAAQELSESEEEREEERESSEPEEEQGEGDALDGWVRNDEQCIDERQKQGFSTRSQPVWTTCPSSCASAQDEDDPTKYFFETCLSWFSKPFFEQMADAMQEEGRGKGAAWASWRVTLDDLWQWIGVWFYMLAFDEKGDRRAYFNPPVGNKRNFFRPRHIVEETLLQGRTGGVKGVKWFENMLTCFTLPGGEEVREDDPFKLTRHMWECCRQLFVGAVSPGWLITLDESMVKWMGRGMPGLMVVPRKPTPVGLEVHTVCCSLSGIMINFEVYEGAQAMERKEYVNELTDIGAINKSTALTLRCVKPYFSSVRALPPSCAMCPIPCPPATHVTSARRVALSSPTRGLARWHVPCSSSGKASSA